MRATCHGDLETHRLFLCARCKRQIRICSRCDRGNVYCPDGCAELSRRESKRRAGRRYQQTSRGAEKHADRQQRYRERQRQKVTHQGSAEPLLAPKEETREVVVERIETTAAIVVEAQDYGCGELQAEASEYGVEESELKTDAAEAPVLARLPCTDDFLEYRCAFCGRMCGPYTRLGFVRRG